MKNKGGGGKTKLQASGIAIAKLGKEGYRTDSHAQQALILFADMIISSYDTVPSRLPPNPPF